ncbi:MAG: hypothetical protein FWG05_01865, partial [Kiritimatiellaeota bacterium]|nr:hypothetical protein [Kiritimatiellota bacterium]
VECTPLDIRAGNALAPVLTTAGILPVVATDSVTFHEGAKIIVSNPDGITGRFALANAPVIETPPLDSPDFLEIPPGYSGKLRIREELDETQTLMLTCFKEETLLIIR